MINLCLLLIPKTTEKDFQWPEKKEVMTEATPEIYGEYRTRALIAKNCAEILEHIPVNTEPHEIMTGFLNEQIKWVCDHSDEHFNHLYFRGLFLETICPYLKMQDNHTGVTNAKKQVANPTDYPAIVNLIWDCREKMESLLTAKSKMTEEELRDTLISYLPNGLNVTAESLNKYGRTDILVKEDGKTIFIAECKICGAPEKFGEAANGLFDKYLGHDQNEATVILFVRQKNYSTFLNKLTAYLKQCSINETFSEVNKGRYVLKIKKDGNTVCFTTLCFHIPRK